MITPCVPRLIMSAKDTRLGLQRFDMLRCYNVNSGKNGQIPIESHLPSDPFSLAKMIRKRWTFDMLSPQ